MKKFLKFLLPLTVILLIGYSELSGHTREESDVNSSVETSNGASVAFYTAAQNCEDLVFKSGQSEFQKANSLNHTANVEEKEDELGSSKKNLEVCNHLDVDFHALATGYFHRYVKKSLFNSRVFSYSPSHNSLLLLIGVLRI